MTLSYRLMHKIKNPSYCSLYMSIMSIMYRVCNALYRPGTRWFLYVVVTITGCIIVVITM